MDQTDLSPEAHKRQTVIRIAQSAGIITGGAYLILAYTRVGDLGVQALIPGSAAALALLAAGLATVRARLSYWLFLAAGFMTLLDLADGYIHALFFLGSFMV